MVFQNSIMKMEVYNQKLLLKMTMLFISLNIKDEM